MANGMRRTWYVLAAVAIVGAVFAIVWEPSVGAFLHRERNRREVLDLYRALAPGMTREEVARQVSAAPYPHLTIRRDDAQLWTAETPLEFGAGNWILFIEFAGGQVRALRVRTANGLGDHPDEAPDDRVLGSE